jgi:hypothetical protein
MSESGEFLPRRFGFEALIEAWEGDLSKVKGEGRVWKAPFFSGIFGRVEEGSLLSFGLSFLNIFAF